MNRDNLRSFVSDLITLAAFAALVFGAIGYASGRPLTACLAVVAAAALGITHLLFLPRRSLGVAERKRLVNFFAGELDRVGQELPAGASPKSGVTLKDFAKTGSLYAEPSVHIEKGSPDLKRGFISWILDEVGLGRRVLILGDPGEGKTLSCQLAYRRLIEEYRANPRRRPVPVLLSLIEVRGLLVDRRSHGDHAETLAQLICGGVFGLPIDPPRVAKVLRHGGFVLVLDGLDELAIHGGSTRETLPPDLARALTGRVVLSCRRVFFDLYLASLPTIDGFEAVASIVGVDFPTSGRAFVERYCRHFNLATADQLVALISGSPSLSDLVTRPLTLFMATDVLAHQLVTRRSEDLQVPEEWTVAEIYERYVRKWLDLERTKGVVLDRSEMEQLCELVAWRIFEMAAAQRPLRDVNELMIGETNLYAVVDAWQGGRPRSLVYSELTTRSFLLRSDGGQDFHFAHKSFFEFFVARRVRNVIATHGVDLQLVVSVLARPLPDEVIDFLRQMLTRLASIQTDKTVIEENLFAILDSAGSAPDDRMIMARQQAGNLLPTVLQEDPESQLRLREVHHHEAHQLIRRGIAVGFALHLDDGSLIDELIADFDADPDALSFHLGYNRIYYGDQLVFNGWRDDAKPPCSRFFRATMRQLANPFYTFLWPMSVRTARELLTEVHRLQDLTERTDLPRHLAELATFASAHRADDRSALANECRQLLSEVALLGGKLSRLDDAEEPVDDRRPADDLGEGAV